MNTHLDMMCPFLVMVLSPAHSTPVVWRAFRRAEPSTQSRGAWHAERARETQVKWGGMSLHVGQRATRSLTLTSQHVKTYAEITGDYNPLHFDAEFASRTKFQRL